MLDTYPFILPVVISWFVLLALPIWMVFYTSWGAKQRPILNRVFVMRCVSITLFVMAVVLMVSGLLQMAGLEIAGSAGSAGYWHALIGLLFILAAIDHIIIHIRDIIRYITPRRKVKVN